MFIPEVLSKPVQPEKSFQRAALLCHSAVIIHRRGRYDDLEQRSCFRPTIGLDACIMPSSLLSLSGIDVLDTQ